MLNGRSAAGLTGLIVALAACGPTVPPDQKASVSGETAAPLEPPPAAVSPEPASPPAEDACGAARYAALVGQPIASAGAPEPSADVRHIRPDTQVTMDYRADRLNIDIDAAGVVTGVRCG